MATYLGFILKHWKSECSISFSSSSQGCVVTVTGRLTFVSNKSMEIEVLVDASSVLEAEKGKYRAVSAFFTFISLDKDNKPLPVPALKVGIVQSPSKVCLSFKTLIHNLWCYTLFYIHIP